MKRIWRYILPMAAYAWIARQYCERVEVKGVIYAIADDYTLIRIKENDND